MTNEEAVKNYYQGIYLTETVLGNPNGDFIDNSPRNIDGEVFTTDKCIKYNVRRFLHENVEMRTKEGEDEKWKDFVYFYPRRDDGISDYENKFITKELIFEKEFDKDFEKLLKASIDVRMFGGTFSFKKSNFTSESKIDPKQIYGPIQISYGKDINNAKVLRLNIGAPFPTSNNHQKTYGSEAIVDDAIISYDISINPNNYPNLLKERDLDLFKAGLWYGTNLRKSTSKRTVSKLLILIKFSSETEDDKLKSINIGELNQLISIKNKDKHKKTFCKIQLDVIDLENKLIKFADKIEKIEIFRDEEEIEINFSNEFMTLFKRDDEKSKIEFFQPKQLFQF